MDIQSVLFVLRFVCGDYLPCYRNRCNLYFKLLHRSVLKKKLSFLARKKNPGISNRHFFLADMNTPDDFDKKFVHRWVDRVFCYLPLGCQKVNRLQRYVSLHYERWPKLDCKFTCNIKSFTEDDNQNQLTASIQWFRNTDNLWHGHFLCRFEPGLYT